MERVFSSGRALLPYTRGSMKPESIRACMCLKCFYKTFPDSPNGTITSAQL